MKLYKYWLGLYPLDWEFCSMPVQTYKNLVTEQYHKSPTLYNISVGSIEKVLVHIDVILSAAMEDQNNTTNHATLRYPPMVFPLPKEQDNNTAEFAVILKMDNDGDTVVYSPISLPHPENQQGGVSVKLNCKRVDFIYTPGEEIFIFPDGSELPFFFDTEKELTADPTTMDMVGEILDETEKLTEKARTAIKVAPADEGNRHHSIVILFMEFHRDDIGPGITTGLFPGTNPSKLSSTEMVDFLRLKRFGNLVDDEIDQQVFIMDLSFNPEITDELMVIYFDLDQEIFCTTHKS